MNAFFTWLIATTLIGWLALPLSFQFFRRLPDRGYAFSKALGLLLFGYLFWFLGSLGFLRNDVGGLTLAAITLLALSFLLVKRHGFAELRAWLRQHGTYVIAVELLFLLAFSGWAWMRAHNPDILGTEKPMEFMFINSILRSQSFPPHDAWLSGHAISYYYFGYLLVAALARLTATASPVAFNLSLALLFALTAASALGASVNLIALARRERASRSQPPPSLMPAFWPALLGPLLVLLVGNFYGVLELAHDNSLFASLRIPAIWYDFGNSPALNGAQSSQDFQQSPGVKAGWINVWEWLDLKRLNNRPETDQDGLVWDLDNWFFAARVVHERNLTGVETEAIDEMPAFSFVLGDLHPHVLALPFVILATGLALDWLLWAREAAAGDSLDRLPRGRLVLSSLVLGGLAFLNTWDFPIYWFLVLLALLAGFASALDWHGFILPWRYLVKLAGSLLILSLALYFPFYLTFQSQAGGILPNLIYPTRFQQTVVMFGPVLAGVIAFLAWLVLIERKSFNLRAALLSGLGIVALLSLSLALFVLVLAINPDNLGLLDQAIYPLTRDQALSLFWQRRLVDSMATLFPAGMIALCAGLAYGFLRQTWPSAARSDPDAFAECPPQERESARCDLRSPAVLMSLAMILTGALLLIGPEFFYLMDNFGTRMNTLFKFYFQAWVLWGLASAFGIWVIYDRARGAVRWLAGGIMALAILSGLVYTAGSLDVTTHHFSRAPALDGMAYFARSYPDDWAAIQWLQSQVEGAPVILEGTRGAYWIEGRSSRLSMATGLPTLLGWANHESQWRGEYFPQVAHREEDIRRIYQARDWQTTQELLDQNSVKYVIVSPLEMEWSHPVQIDKFERFMRPVFQSGDLTIYER